MQTTLEAMRSVAGFDRLTDRARAVIRKTINFCSVSGPTVGDALRAFIDDPSSLPGRVLTDAGVTVEKISSFSSTGSAAARLSLPALIDLANEESKRDPTAAGKFVGSEHLFLALIGTAHFRNVVSHFAYVDGVVDDMKQLLSRQANEAETGRSVLQPWVMQLPLMQQSGLLTVIRGPDGLHKGHIAKDLCRWLRRCLLITAFEGASLLDPYDRRGGSFTGPSRYPAPNGIDDALAEYMDSVDEAPLHFHLHLVQAAEIIGYQHPVNEIRNWWRATYEKFVAALHLQPESKEMLNYRLRDDPESHRKAGEGDYSEATNVMWTPLERWVLIFTHESGTSTFEFLWKGKFGDLISYDDDGHVQLTPDQQSVLDASGFLFEEEKDERLLFERLESLPDVLPTLG